MSLPQRAPIGGESARCELMAVPEPLDKAFVERVRLELVQARHRCSDILADDETQNDSPR
jgi:hypothetical protein